jgi:hypothetical protein
MKLYDFKEGGFVSLEMPGDGRLSERACIIGDSHEACASRDHDVLDTRTRFELGGALEYRRLFPYINLMVLQIPASAFDSIACDVIL